MRPKIAPVKCSLLPLMSTPELLSCVAKTQCLLKKKLVSCKVDDSGQSIGKRYARTDEIGIPFAVTVDFDTIKDGSVAVREVDSCVQVRVQEDQLGELMKGLSLGLVTWSEVMDKYPRFSVD